MAKFEYPANICKETTSAGCVVMIDKEGRYGISILIKENGPDVRVDWGSPTSFQQRACLEQAVILGWA